MVLPKQQYGYNQVTHTGSGAGLEKSFLYQFGVEQYVRVAIGESFYLRVC